MATYADLVYEALYADQDATALVWEDGSLTYGQAASAISQIAHTLRELGLEKGDGVAVLSTNHPKSFLLMIGAIVAGCRYTPLHPLGSAADHAAVIARAEISAFFYEAEVYGDHVARMEGLPAQVSSIEDFSYAGRPTTRPDVDLTAEDLAFLPFTGGTTGQPKGVMLPHRAMVANASMTLAGWDIPDRPRYLAVTPVSHAAGIIVLPVLLSGGTVYLLRQLDLDGIAQAIRDHRPTMTFLVPAIIYALLDAGTDLSGFETIVYGAAPISPVRLREAIDRFGPIFVQLYGQTEAPNTVTALRRAEHTPERLSSCGRPVPGVDVRLLREDGSETDPGEAGEICVRGPLVMDGYWREPELTAETIREGWLHTGDQARRDADGFLTIVDRTKDMIVTGGFNVFSREVEAVIEEHPAVAQVAVIGVPHDRWGEAVTAVVVRRGDVTAAELTALVREHKGPVHAPKRVEFVDSIPLTALAKPDKKALRQTYWATSERQVS